MADRFVFDAQGMHELFESPEGPLGKEIVRICIRVDRRAKRMAPVDTGRLRASITHELGRDEQGLVGRVGTNVIYAPFQEYGTSRMPAHPYLRPALAAEVGGTP